MSAKLRAPLFVVLAFAGCAAEPPAPVAQLAGPTDIAVAAEPARPTDVAVAPATSVVGDVFGTAPDLTRPLVPLAQLLEEPSAFEQQLVRTEGEVAQVCQRMGCWMELRDGADGPRVRVPMANHAFFLPRDAAGRRATVEGRVALRALSADHRAHLESEGATATASALALEATGVILHPR